MTRQNTKGEIHRKKSAWDTQFNITTLAKIEIQKQIEKQFNADEAQALNALKEREMIYRNPITSEICSPLLTFCLLFFFFLQIVFQFTRGVRYDGDIAIDDVIVTSYACPGDRKYNNNIIDD